MIFIQKNILCIHKMSRLVDLAIKRSSGPFRILTAPPTEGSTPADDRTFLETAQKGVAYVVAWHAGDSFKREGLGFFVNATGRLIICSDLTVHDVNYVYREDIYVRIPYYNGTNESQTVKFHIVGTDAIGGIAVCEPDVPMTAQDYLEWGDDTAVQIMDNLHIIVTGYGTQSLMLKSGKLLSVESLHATVSPFTLFLLDIQENQVGSPVLNSEGQVVGVRMNQFNDYDSAILPSTRVQFIIDKIVSLPGNFTDRGYLGVRGDPVDINSKVSRQTPLPGMIDTTVEYDGVVLTDVDASGNVNGTLAVDDVITKIDGVKVGKTSSISDLLWSKVQGDSVDISYLLNSEGYATEHTDSITLSNVYNSANDFPGQGWA
jgi:S1-C subfamily serine protease